MKVDWGNVADWVSGLGGLLSVLFVAWTAIVERYRRMAAEDLGERLHEFHRSEIAQAAADHLNELATAVIKVPQNAVLSKLTYGLERTVGEKARMARDAIAVLRSLQHSDPILQIALLRAEQACEIGDLDTGTPVWQMHAVASANSRLVSARYELMKLVL